MPRKSYGRLARKRGKNRGVVGKKNARRAFGNFLKSFLQIENIGAEIGYARYIKISVFGLHLRGFVSQELNARAGNLLLDFFRAHIGVVVARNREFTERGFHFQNIFGKPLIVHGSIVKVPVKVVPQEQYQVGLFFINKLDSLSNAPFVVKERARVKVGNYGNFYVFKFFRPFF